MTPFDSFEYSKMLSDYREGERRRKWLRCKYIGFTVISTCTAALRQLVLCMAMLMVCLPAGLVLFWLMY